MSETTQLWADFAQRCSLDEHKVNLFKKYYDLLIEHNDQFNLTTITELTSVLAHHFEDSLALGTCTDISNINNIVDVGSGGGFPGIALKIAYPHLNVVLIEVTHKKINFLERVINELNLENIHVYPLDWRTFLRTTDYEVDLMCARASLQPLELLRMFRQTCVYRTSTLVYWAAQEWTADTKEQKFIIRECEYQIKRKKRKLVFFSQIISK